VTLDGGFHGGLNVVYGGQMGCSNLLVGQVFGLQLDIGGQLNLRLYLNLPLVMSVVSFGANHLQKL
jgi:hypothetical protein